VDKPATEFMRPVRAFEMLDIGNSRGYEALQKGEIPYVRIAGQIRIPRKWIEEQVTRALAAVSDER